MEGAALAPRRIPTTSPRIANCKSGSCMPPDVKIATITRRNPEERERERWCHFRRGQTPTSPPSPPSMSGRGERGLPEMASLSSPRSRSPPNSTTTSSSPSPSSPPLQSPPSPPPSSPPPPAPPPSYPKAFPPLATPVKSSSSTSTLSPPPPLMPPPPPLSRPGGNLTTKGNPPPSQFHQLRLPFIVGITAGIGMFVVLMIVFFACCTRRKKKKPHNPMHYYADSVHKVNGYYTSGPQSEWHTGPQTMDQFAKVSPSASSIVQPGGSWHQRQTSAMSSGEMSYVAYSGPNDGPLPPPTPKMALGFNKSTFTYDELAAATNNFSPPNLLGQGGFGYVHKGVLPNGQVIAVKQLKAGSGQGEREFQAEVDIISRVHHRHLVSLVGYCISGAKRLLVYEFVPNRTLEYHLHARGIPPMTWPTRLRIAIGSAKGFAYLHEDCNPRIIHRDIKSANILIDYKFEAMVADFGLAKLTNDNFTHVSTRVMGTFGYLAPEYASSGKLTEKSDVFSFGVMLLELIAAKRPVDTHSFIEDSLVDWARPLLSRALAEGNYDDLVDRRLDGNYDPMEMARMVACAAACVRHSARRRPKMSQIVRALEGDVSLEDLNEGMRPGQSMLFSSGSDYESGSYTSNKRQMRLAALGSPEYSGEYSGPLPGSGHYLSGSSSDFSGELNPIGHQRHRSHPPI